MKHIIKLREDSVNCDCHIDAECDCGSYPMYALLINGKSGRGYVESVEDGYICNILGAVFPIPDLEALESELMVRFSCFGEIICKF